MVKNIMRNPFFLAKKSVPASKADAQIVEDLLDTLHAHKAECVGMAANMIGENKNIIVVNAGLMDLVLINAKITKKSGQFTTEEGCLSLVGVRKCTRYKNIEVEYLDRNFNIQRSTFSDWTAQIIQHELDHVNGIVI